MTVYWRKLADIEASRCGVRIAVVNVFGRRMLRRYDWLIDAMERESRYVARRGGRNVFKDTIIEYISR